MYALIEYRAIDKNSRYMLGLLSLLLLSSQFLLLEYLQVSANNCWSCICEGQGSIEKGYH